MDLKKLRWIKLALILVIASYFLSAWNEVQEVDPAQYAEIAREMAESNDWLTLRDNYGPYLDKPPVTIWMIAACFKVFGVSNFAYRLPAILCAILSIFFLGRTARILYDRDTAWLSMLIIASCEAWFLMVGDPKIDMVLVCFLTLCFWAYFEARTRPRFFYLFYIFIGLAVMTKGPIGFMIPLMAMGMEWFFLRDWKEIWRMKPISGVVILAVVIAPWYLVLYQDTGGRGPYFMLWEQSFGRIFIRTFKNQASPFFFVTTFLWAFLPWTSAAIFMIAVKLSEFRKREDKFSYQPRRVLTWWFVLPFIFISLSSYKLDQYLFWLLPPMAILCADFIVRAPEYQSRKWFVHFFRGQNITTVSIVAAAFLTVIFCFPIEKPWLWLVPAFGLLGLLSIAFVKMGPVKNLAVLPCLAILFFSIVFYLQIYPGALNFQYGTRMGRMLKEKDPLGKVVYSCKIPVSKALAFYSGRKVEKKDPEQMKSVLSQGRESFVAVREINFQELADALGPGCKIETLGRFPEFHTSRPTIKFLLLKTRPKTLNTVLLLRISPI